MDGRVVIDRPVVRHVGPHGKRHRLGLFPRAKSRERKRHGKEEKSKQRQFSRLNMDRHNNNNNNNRKSATRTTLENGNNRPIEEKTKKSKQQQRTQKEEEEEDGRRGERVRQKKYL